VLILKVRHIWAPTIQQTCAKTTLVIAESWVWEQRLGAPPTPLPFRHVRTLSSWSTRPGQLRRRRSSVARFPASSTIRRDLARARRGKCLKTKIEPHSVGAFYPLHRKRESQVGGADAVSRSSPRTPCTCPFTNCNQQVVGSNPTAGSTFQTKI
jgi:hypothetical protein